MLKFLIVVFKILLIIGAIGSFIAEFEKDGDMELL